MNVKIQSVKFDADQKLVDFIQLKLSKIGRFADNILSADVTLKIDKDDEVGNKVAIVKLNVAGGELVADRRSKSFEESVDLCIDAIKKQIEKFKESANSIRHTYCLI